MYLLKVRLLAFCFLAVKGRRFGVGPVRSFSSVSVCVPAPLITKIKKVGASCQN